MRGLLRIAAIMVLVSSCSKTSMEKTANWLGLGSGDELISDRPQTIDKMFVTVKLNAQPLLLTATKDESGKRVVSPEAKQTLEVEQQQLIAELQKISSEIQIIYRYKMIFNGMALLIPTAVLDRIPQVPGIAAVMPSGRFERPMVEETKPAETPKDLNNNNSVSFIEAQKVWKDLKIEGNGIRVGVLDTGVDFTHKMLGGPGTEEAFKSVDPKAATSLFPNAKVVGGIDLVGTDYDAAADTITKQIPVPDANPIDEAGHGSHVAGTIAGIGDGVNTYSGVAPGAQVYAIKVFGAGGSVSDTVVVAGLDYAADPNGDGVLDDQLDVVNMSLGGAYGQPQVLYREAINNLTAGGTVVVASAGNSGNADFIVGSPSTSDSAISVAASIDGMEKNWSFSAVRFVTAENPNMLVKLVEGPISKPVSEAGDVKGKLVYIGLADQPISDELKAKLKDNIALIDRGGVPFLQKLTLAQDAGALGAVVANNADGEPIQMGGEGQVAIPGTMITKALGAALKTAMASGDVTIEFKTDQKIEDPKLIDTLTDFSSKGPRSQDALIKPEITAPGYQIISAAMGSGDKGVEFSGTSMSGPHITGVMALLKQYRNDLSVAELKSLVISSATSIDDVDDKLYAISRQGAGRVQTFKAATNPLVMDVATLSLGHVQVNAGKLVEKQVTVKNTSDQAMSLDVVAKTHSNLSMVPQPTLNLAPGESKTLNIEFLITPPQVEGPYAELDGFVFFKARNQEVARMPVLALVTQLTKVVAKNLKVRAGSAIDGSSSTAELVLENQSLQTGGAFIFNLLGVDERKSTGGSESTFRSRDCDLQAAGYRIVEKDIQGEKSKVLQVGVKLYRPQTTWHYCQISVQIDSNNDQLADQELGGIFGQHLSGVSAPIFASVLLDAVSMRDIRLKFEKDLASGQQATLDYTPAIQDALPMYNFAQSSVAIVEVKMSSLKLRPSGELAIKVATLNQDTDAIEADDFLDRSLDQWQSIDPNAAGGGFYNMPEVVEIEGGASATIGFNKGEGQNPLLILFPTNRVLFTDVGMDEQATIIEPSFSLAQ